MVYARNISTTIQIRIDEPMKAQAKKIFKKKGLDLSSGIKFLLARELKPKNITYICDYGFLHKYTPKMLAKYEKEAQWALKHGKRYSSTKEMFDDIEAGK